MGHMRDSARAMSIHPAHLASWTLVEIDRMSSMREDRSHSHSLTWQKSAPGGMEEEEKADPSIFHLWQSHSLRDSCLRPLSSFSLPPPFGNSISITLFALICHCHARRSAALHHGAGSPPTVKRAPPCQALLYLLCKPRSVC